jgi:acetyl-CoA/propionyl-CoA carboxylase biotin carboxyl carrier protein
VRVDSGVEEGGEVVGLYDPMVAKLVVWDVDRPRAIARMRRALDEFEVEGVPTLLPLHRLIFAHPAFVAGETCAGLVEGTLAAQLAPAGPAEAARPRPLERVVEVEIDGRRHEVRVFEVDTLASERQRREERRARGRQRSGGGEAIASPMQGTVVRVEVAEGEPVESGRVLVIVEAMKMENEIAADRPGVVADVRVAPGDSVRSGQVLLSVVDGG